MTAHDLSIAIGGPVIDRPYNETDCGILSAPHGGRSSAGRALDCGSSGRGFEPLRPPSHSLTSSVIPLALLSEVRPVSSKAVREFPSTFPVRLQALSEPGPFELRSSRER